MYDRALSGYDGLQALRSGPVGDLHTSRSFLLPDRAVLPLLQESQQTRLPLPAYPRDESSRRRAIPGQAPSRHTGHCHGSRS